MILLDLPITPDSYLNPDAYLQKSINDLKGTSAVPNTIVEGKTVGGRLAAIAREGEGTGGKFDGGKAPVSLIPQAALMGEAEVMGFGAKKYAAQNWRGGMAWSRCLDAAMRHILAFNEGEDLDPESGISHLAHARCCLAFVMDYQKRGAGLDDRWREPTA